MKADLMLESAVNFMINSMFACIGILLIVGTVILINNLIHKYWKPVNIFKKHDDYIDMEEPQLHLFDRHER